MDPFAKPPTISDDYRMAEIYRQSSDVFYEKGFEATTMAEIAESVDLTQGGLYYYIKGKKALLFAIMSYALDLLETEVLNPSQRLEDPKACLTRLIGGYVRLACEEPSVIAMLALSEDYLETAHTSKIRSRKRLLTGFLRDVIASLVCDRDAHGTPEAAAQQAIEMIQSVRSWNEGGRLSYSEVTEEIIDRTVGDFFSEGADGRPGELILGPQPVEGLTKYAPAAKIRSARRTFS